MIGFISIDIVKFYFGKCPWGGWMGGTAPSASLPHPLNKGKNSQPLRLILQVVSHFIPIP